MENSSLCSIFLALYNPLWSDINNISQVLHQGLLLQTQSCAKAAIELVDTLIHFCSTWSIDRAYCVSPHMIFIASRFYKGIVILFYNYKSHVCTGAFCIEKTRMKYWKTGREEHKNKSSHAICSLLL